MKILLAVDGSKIALEAARQLIAHVGWFKELPQVRVVTVHRPVPHVGGMSAMVSRQMLDQYYQDEGRKALEDTESLLKKANVPFTSTVLVDDPATGICAEARSAGSELIWMGARGMSAAANMMLGSVATKVLHAATAPVTVVTR